MTTKKNLKYYLNLKWSYTIEQESHRGEDYYIIRVNELPGVCTDSSSIEDGLDQIQEALKATINLYLKEGTPIPGPIDIKKFKGNISYRTTTIRHYKLAQFARRNSRSLSKALDMLIDTGLEEAS